MGLLNSATQKWGALIKRFVKKRIVIVIKHLYTKRNNLPGESPTRETTLDNIHRSEHASLWHFATILRHSAFEYRAIQRSRHRTKARRPVACGPHLPPAGPPDRNALANHSLCAAARTTRHSYEPVVVGDNPRRLYSHTVIVATPPVGDDPDRECRQSFMDHSA